REAEFKKQRVFNTCNGVAKPVWTNANWVNHANQFVLRSVQLNAGRPNINYVRPNFNTGRTNINYVRPNINIGRTNINSVRPNINTGRENVNSVRPNVNTGRVNVNSVRLNVNTGRVNVNYVKSNVNTGRTNVNPVRPRVNTSSSNVNTVRSRQPVPTKTRPFAKTTAQMSHSNAVMRNWGSAVKTSASYNWRNSRPNFNYNSGSTFIRTVNAKGHMTGNKDQLEDFKEFNGGSVTFGWFPFKHDKGNQIPSPKPTLRLGYSSGKRHHEHSTITYTEVSSEEFSRSLDRYSGSSCGVRVKHVERHDMNYSTIEEDCFHLRSKATVCCLVSIHVLMSPEMHEVERRSPSRDDANDKEEEEDEDEEEEEHLAPADSVP
ncbi:hypothetical protein Tco_0787565, partial [Tanacetum coccineum]